MASALPAPASASSSYGASTGGVSVRGKLLSRLIILIASTTLIASLCGVAFNPRRFQIHPIPYISDAGLFDPERIVLSMGLSFAAALFLPFCCALYSYHIHVHDIWHHKRTHHMHHGTAKLGLISGIILAASLIAFASVPGWYLPHHFLAAFFAISSAAWCVCVARVRILLKRPYKLVYYLGLLQVAIVAVFAVVWSSIITGFPWKMVPNKDARFVLLAILEYIGTSSFLVVVHRVGTIELGNVDIRIATTAAAQSYIPRTKRKDASSSSQLQ